MLVEANLTFDTEVYEEKYIQLELNDFRQRRFSPEILSAAAKGMYVKLHETSHSYIEFHREVRNYRFTLLCAYIGFKDVKRGDYFIVRSSDYDSTFIDFDVPHPTTWLRARKVMADELVPEGMLLYRVL